MVIARLAWNQLNDGERAKVIAMLKKHPNYDDYLCKDRSKDYSEEEWVFVRAATWSDWIRDEHKDKHDHWHQISLPYVPPGSKIDRKKHLPLTDEDNIVTRLPKCVRRATEGSDADRAINLAWVVHLVGDIHQPLHCTTRFDDKYPDGDDNALDAMIRVNGDTVSLHQWWDSIHGHDTSGKVIDADAKDVQDLIKKEPDLVRDDLESHKTFESWAEESFDVAQKWVYLDGKLKTLPKPKSSSSSSANDAPELPNDYAENAKRVAWIQFAKAGVRLTQQIRNILAKQTEHGK
jgi:hypothetical protein